MEELFDTGEFLAYAGCPYVISSNIAVELEYLECMFEDKSLQHGVVVSGTILYDPIEYPGVLWEDKTSRMDTRIARDIEEYYVSRIGVNCYGLIKTPLLADIIVLDKCKISRTKSKAIKRILYTAVPVAIGDDPESNSIIEETNTFNQGEFTLVTSRAFGIQSDFIIELNGIEYNVLSVREAAPGVVEISVQTR